MKMKTYIIRTMLAAATAVMAAGCAVKEDVRMPEYSGVGVYLAADGSFPLSADDRIVEVAGYRFADGILQEILLPETSGNGLYTFHPETRQGRMYLVANMQSFPAFSSLKPGASMSEFTKIRATAEELMHNGAAMTAAADLGGLPAGVSKVRMTRSVARIDVSTFGAGVQVLKISLKGAAGEGYVFPDAGVDAENDASAASEDLETDFSENPLENTRSILFYLPEQHRAGMEVEAVVSYGGGTSLLRSELPEDIKRNRVYNIEVRGKGAGLALSVAYDEWETGGETEAGSSPRGLVDVENSVLPAGVRVNGTLDTVYVTYRAVDFELAVSAEPSAEVRISGDVDGVDIVRQPSGRVSFTQAAVFSVTGRLRMPGSGAGRIHLDVFDGEVNAGRIVLVFEENPMQLTGLLRFDADGVCDLGRYVDGELGTVTLPAGKSLGEEFPEGGNAWMKTELVSEDEAGRKTYRILGGWRPNDPEADGRVQEGYVVVSDDSGEGSERYSVKRLNWGLPVVRIGTAWWTLFNLRGDSQSFEDQITMGSVPDTGTGLFEYLQTVSGEELLTLMGDQYQSGNRYGLPLEYDGNAFLYRGMNASAGDFGSADPSSAAPSGYRIPSYADYAFFAASDNYNIGGTGSRSFVNRSGETVEVRVAERTAAFAGGDYGPVAFYEFTHDGQSWVLYGLGHQWNTAPGNVAKMYILLATSGSPGMSWAMEGYASDDRPGQNWMKFTAQNNTKTRTVRCIKTPVEYIY